MIKWEKEDTDKLISALRAAMYNKWRPEFMAIYGRMTNQVIPTNKPTSPEQIIARKITDEMSKDIDKLFKKYSKMIRI